MKEALAKVIAYDTLILLVTTALIAVALAFLPVLAVLALVGFFH